MNNLKALYFTILLIAIGISVGCPVKAQGQTGERTYVKIEVDGLSCPFCAYGLEKKIKDIEDADHITINVSDGNVTFDVPREMEPTRERLRKIVKKAGFTAREIVFAEKPFTDE